MLARRPSSFLAVLACYAVFPPTFFGEGVRRVGVSRFAKGFGNLEPTAKTEEQQFKTKKGLKSTKAAIAFFDKAKEYRDAGNNAKAVQMFRKARVAIAKAAGKGSKDYARVCSDLATTYLDLDKRDRAEELYQESRKAFEVAVGRNDGEYAGCLRNLARLKRALGDIQETEALLKEASHIYSGDLSRFHEEYALTLRSLASLYQEQGRMELLQPILLQEQRVRTLAASLGGRR
ncbi:KLC2 [Symbiodinium natans]|uniref:KLC2 protein n=1 Tax=Symbiodinium natans TaxID=878477 RepID=A0A812NNE2_9DINO|nr:KLC2 [Symbiodinium natans]